MPVHGLNQTPGLVPYKGDKSAARPPEGCPAEAGGPFGPESALGFEHPSGTNARRPSYKSGGHAPNREDSHHIFLHIPVDGYAPIICM